MRGLETTNPARGTEQGLGVSRERTHAALSLPSTHTKGADFLLDLRYGS